MWPTAFSYGGDMKWLLCQWTLLSQPKISPCNQAQLDVCPGAVPQASSPQCHWWGIDNKQLLPPQQWSPEPSSLGSRPMRVEIASSNSIWLPTLRKKNYRNSRSETEIGSQKFLSVYLLHHGTVCSSRGPKTSYAEAFKVPTVACRYLLFTAVSGGPH